MADPDTYESDEDQASTASTTAGVKFYQIAVPSFQEVNPPSGISIPTKLSDGTTPITTFTGSSFLRIGSSPASWNDSTFQNSLNLARLVGDPDNLIAVEGITVDGTGMISSNNYNDGNASTLAAAGSSAFSEGFQDGRGVQTAGFGTNQDPNFLLGFADDVRNHGPLPTTSAPNAAHASQTNVNGNPVSNTNPNRQAETLRLLTKGGWWDHSDGNRITTTSGDKIEVIQGNYKIMVLGRQPAPSMPTVYVDLGACFTLSSSNPPSGTTSTTISALESALKAWYADSTQTTPVTTAWNAVPAAAQGTITVGQIQDQYKYAEDASALATNTFVTDLSGGHFQEQYPSPTPCIKTVEYVQDDAGEWTLYQDNGLGNLITKLKGRTVDLFQGSSRETYVGSNSTTLLWANGGSAPTSTTSPTATDLRLDPMIASYTWAQSIYAQTGSATKPIGFGAASTNPNAQANAGPQPTGVITGDVVSKTWASRVMSYTGSSDAAVAMVYSETHATEIQSLTTSSGNNTSTTTSTGGTVSSSTTAVAVTGYTTSTGGAVTSTTQAAGDVTSSTTASGGNVTSTTTANPSGPGGSGGNVTSNTYATGGTIINHQAAGNAVFNFTGAVGLVSSFTGSVAGITNVNATGFGIVNINAALSVWNVDLTPMNLHCGMQATELWVWKKIIAGRTDL